MYSSTDLKVAKLHERHPTAESTASPSTRTRPATMTSPVLYPVEVAEEDLLWPDTPAARRRAYCATPTTRATPSVGVTRRRRSDNVGGRGGCGERGGLRLGLCSPPPTPPLYIGGKGEGGRRPRGRGRRPRWAPLAQTLTPSPREGGRLPHGPLWGPFRWAAPLNPI